MKSVDPINEVLTPYKCDDWVITPTYRRGDYNSLSVDAPFVFFFDGQYRMFHNDYDGVGYRTGLASSTDLVNWQEDGLVLERGPAGSPTEFNATVPGVLRENDLFSPGSAKLIDGMMLGVWHGYPQSGREQGKGYFGLARGEGLQSWELDEPLLTADDCDAGSWERGGLYKPMIVEHEGRYYIFYNAKESLDWPWREQIGVAVSDDLKHWTRCEDNPVIANGSAGSPDEWFAADPCVLRRGNIWVMFYYGLAADGHARELVAFSDDLLHWRKSDRVLINVGSEGSIDSMYAHKPGIAAKDGILFHYYGAARPNRPEDAGDVQDKDRRGIGLATSRPIDGVAQQKI